MVEDGRECHALDRFRSTRSKRCCLKRPDCCLPLTEDSRRFYQLLSFFFLLLRSFVVLQLLAGSSWGSDANTLRTSALALIFSTAEYCAPGFANLQESTGFQGNQLLSQNFNISEAWTNSWISSDIPNKNLITSPSVRIPGFSLPRREWVLLNRFRTGQGRCAELMKLWGYTKDPNCACNVPQSMSHILDDCPLYKFNGGISNLHSVTPEALNWLKACLSDFNDQEVLTSFF
ncbi:hypothetical protein LAZ67_X000001 [Cordylochernes scorpioides]|uniref:Uncharacterized protein n=1 Tax=Cordylochernes scorpioides TaxID=51811 RepID=A0ABY6LW41_9ARAC|nr:hypothetical protein LAZ67_X000001 [Cordylochernes scorpioides]